MTAPAAELEPWQEFDPGPDPGDRGIGTDGQVYLWSAGRGWEPEQEPEARLMTADRPATGVDVVAVLRGEITGPDADAVLSSYFAPGPEPRYDTPELQAEAEAGS